jgi:hypothetical protein
MDPSQAFAVGNLILTAAVLIPVVSVFYRAGAMGRDLELLGKTVAKIDQRQDEQSAVQGEMAVTLARLEAEFRAHLQSHERRRSTG